MGHTKVVGLGMGHTEGVVVWESSDLYPSIISTHKICPGNLVNGKNVH